MIAQYMYAKFEQDGGKFFKESPHGKRKLLNTAIFDTPDQVVRYALRSIAEEEDGVQRLSALRDRIDELIQERARKALTR